MKIKKKYGWYIWKIEESSKTFWLIVFFYIRFLRISMNDNFLYTILAIDNVSRIWWMNILRRANPLDTANI